MLLTGKAHRVVKRCRQPATLPATLRFSLAKKWPLTIKRLGKFSGEMVPVPATFHHSPDTSNLFDNP